MFVFRSPFIVLPYKICFLDAFGLVQTLIWKTVTMFARASIVLCIL